MPIRGRHERDEGEGDEDLTPFERREALRVQRELLAVLHSDREARTRASDGSAVARLVASAVPLVVGILLGVFGTLSLVVGRIATVEADNKAQAEQISQNVAAIARVGEQGARTLDIVTRLDSYVRSKQP